MAYWGKKIFDELPPIKDLINDIKDKNNTLLAPQQTKNPDSHLHWVYDNVLTTPVYHTNISEPDKVLHGDTLVNGKRTIFRYGEIGNAESLEYGIEWQDHMEGFVRFIHVTPNYVLYVTSQNIDTEDFEKTWIYRADDIHSTPELIIENDSGFALEMTCHAYYDGFSDVILVGMYGRAANHSRPRDLLLSTDGGRTFELIKQTTVTDQDKNSHWHAAWFDHFQGRIWAAEGDGPNRNTHFSDDYGVKWYTLDGDKPDDERHQPTLIFGWGERVIFGRDANYKRPGLDSFERVYTSSEREQPKTVIDKYTLRTDTIAAVTYPRRGIAYTETGEAYVVFRSSNRDSVQLLATGDWGRSWQCVHSSRYSDTRIRDEITGVTHDGYICGVVSGHSNYSASRLVYAKTPKWSY